MNKIKLISDSSCDLPDDLLQKYDIDLLPLYIIMGENSYKDGKEISQEEVFAWSDANNTTPKTAAPSLQDAMDILNLYVKDYDDIIVINISSEVSTTYQVMNIAAREYPNANIHIIDSRSVSAGVATLVLKAAKMKETGATDPKNSRYHKSHCTQSPHQFCGRYNNLSVPRRPLLGIGIFWGRFSAHKARAGSKRWEDHSR